MPRLVNPKQRNERVTAQLDAAFSVLYNYKYIIVSPDEIFTNKKYADVAQEKKGKAKNDMGLHQIFSFVFDVRF